MNVPAIATAFDLASWDSSFLWNVGRKL